MWVAIGALFLWCLILQRQAGSSQDVEALNGWSDTATSVINLNDRRIDKLEDRVSDLEYDVDRIRRRR